MPVLVAALIERRMGYTGSTNELTWIVLYPIALGTTVSLLVARSFAEISLRSRRASRAGAIRDRPLHPECRGDQPGNRVALTERRKPRAGGEAPAVGSVSSCLRPCLIGDSGATLRPGYGASEQTLEEEDRSRAGTGGDAVFGLVAELLRTASPSGSRSGRGGGRSPAHHSSRPALEDAAETVKYVLASHRRCR